MANIEKEQKLALLRTKEEEKQKELALIKKKLLGYEELEPSQELEVYSKFKRVDINELKNLQKKL